MNANGHPSCIKMAPKPFFEASHSNTKVMEKPSTTNIGMLHMAFFKMENAFSTTSLHENAFFLSRDGKGDVILL